MQAFDKDNQPKGDAVPFDAKKMEKLLEDAAVDHVKVFHLTKGDTLTIRDQKYKVTKIMSGGRAVIKRQP
jgi:hypothetical protein